MFEYFTSIPTVSQSLSLGYVCLSGRYFGARLDFEHQKCHILQEIHGRVNFNRKEAYHLRGTPWLMIHKKTNTLYKIINPNDESTGTHRRSHRLQLKIQLEWKPVRKFQINDPRAEILCFTQDYILLSKDKSYKYRVQCIRSGRVINMMSWVRIRNNHVAMVCQLFYNKEVSFLDSTQQ